AGLGFSLYSLPSGERNSMVRATASQRLRCPSMQLIHVGEFESSKSAMKTLAPELSALMIIFRSGGPVISTRRSRRSEGIGATFQEASLVGREASRNWGNWPASRRA